jgi:hypothetical protein
MVGRVVKNVRVIYDWPSRESVHVPRCRIQNHVDAVKCLPGIWPFSYVYKASGPEFKFLSTNTNLQRSVFGLDHSDIREPLLDP